MKRIIALLLILAMGLCSTAYSESNTTDTQPTQAKGWLELAKTVNYIFDRDVRHITPDNVQRIWFAFKDENDEIVTSPAIVDVTIVNDSDEIVYQKTHYVDPSDYGTWTNSLTNTSRVLCSFDIPDSDIMPTSSKNGLIKVNVHYKNSDYYSGEYDVFAFEEWVSEVYDLPYDSPTARSAMQIPDTPIEVKSFSHAGNLESSVNVEGISYAFSDGYDAGTVNLEILFTGQKTYDRSGDTESTNCHIGYKLYLDDYVIKSGDVRTNSLEVGERFKNESVSFSGLEPGEYRLKIVDVK